MTEETIFALALEQPDAPTRAAFLADACGADAALRQRVEALLRTHEKVGDFLNKPVVEQLAAPPEGSDATQAFNAATDAKEPAMPRTEGEGSSDEQDTPLDFLQPSTRPDSLGRIGHYEVLQILGQGGFGIVFRAFDEVLQRVVALKVLAPAIASTSPARKRFLREARSSAQVRHDNVVQTYAVEEKPVPYLVMEFIPGETLQQRLDRVGPLDVPEILRLGRQIAEGLAAAHATDLIHRDIKPGNVLLEGGNLRVKITDFGLARAADDASMTRSGVLAGTPMYMAPEQANGDALDHRADLFSLGSVLYQMTTGRPPFRATSTLAVLKRVAEDTPRPIREVIPETPQWLCDIITKLHAKNPENRFQSAREVADLLGDCEAKLKAKNAVKYALPAAVKPAGRKWAAAAALVLLPVIALAVTEFAGVTHLFRPQATTDPTRSGVEPTPVVIAKNEIPVPMAKSAPLPPTFKNGIGMEFVIVPKGKSWLGGGKDKLGDKEVVIPADFYLGKYEVTQGEWEKVMGEHTSFFSRNGGAKDRLKEIPDAELMRFPVEDVTWDQCQIFVAKLNKSEKKTGWIYRLPTEAEWEYACRGGPMADKADSAFDFYLAGPTNTLFVPEQANATQYGGDTPKTLGRTCKVGSYAPNVLGLYDMHGNVWEWCEDTVKADNGVSHRPARGGSHPNPSMDCRAAKRTTELPSFYTNALGLRLARVPSGAPSAEVKTPPATAAPSSDPDRQVAEYVLSLGGMVRVDGSDRDIRAKGELPKETFRLTRISLSENKMMTDSDLAAFKDCKNLTDLNLFGTSLSNDGLRHLKDSTILLRLNLGRTLVDESGLELVKGCSDLTGLYLTDNKHMTDAALRHVKSWKKLLELHVGGTQVTDEGILHLLDCKSLMFLAVDQTAVTAAAREKLHQALPQCRIFFSGGEIEPSAVIPFTDADVQRIAALPAAEQVEEVRKELMRRNPGFDGKLEHKIEDSVVTELRIVTDRVTDIAPIRVFTALRALKCGGTWTRGIPNGLLADLSPLERMNLEGLTYLDLPNTRVSDAGMAYFKDCKDLKALYLDGTKVTDKGLVHFQDCKDLRFLNLGNTKVSDAGLARFKDCKNLTQLYLANTQVTDDGLANFKDCRGLTDLFLAGTKVSDAGLGHFKDIPLNALWIDNTGVTDLSPLRGMPLRGIYLTPKNITRGLDILRDMKSLKTIGVEWDKVWPAAEFWQRYDKGEFGKAAALFTDSDVRRIAALPAAEQVEEVRKELMRRNPGFDGKLEHKIEDGVVTEFGIVTDKVTDIAPIRVWSALRVLTCAGSSWRSGLRADLTPLVGMNLALLTHLDLKDTRVSDAGMVYFKDCKNLTQLRLTTAPVTDAGLAHFKDCKNLTVLRLGGTGVTDAGLVYFKDCKALMKVHLQVTKVSDAGLAHFKGAPLTELFIDHTSITDLTPLQGMRLEVIRLTPRNITRGLDILRDMKSLKTIGIGYEKDQTWPAAEFWKRYDKGEFTK